MPDHITGFSFQFNYQMQAEISGLKKNAPMRILFLKNALANVIGGLGTAIFNLLLPALVARYLDKLDFTVWNLALQVIVYLQIFGFGLQNAITRFIAHGHELNDLQDQRKTVKAGLMLTGLFASLALLAVATLIAFYPVLFSDIPPEMVVNFRICIAVLGISATWQLFALVPNGIFIGLQQNIIPVGVQLFVRVLSLCVIFVVLEQCADLTVLSIAFAISGALLVPLSLMAVYRWAGEKIRGMTPLDKERFRELLSYCGTMAAWNIAILLISGLATMLVGYFDFGRVAAYSLAVTLITIMSGLQQALMSPLISAGAKLNARPESRAELPALLIRSTRICVAGLLVSVIMIKFFGDWFLKIWLGSGYSDDIISLLIVLSMGAMVRNATVPYAMLLMALNMQKQALATAFVEGVVTIGTSLLLGHRFGALGVAFGALIGSVVGSLSQYLYNFKRTRVLVPNIREYGIRSGAFLVIPVAIIFLLIR